MLSRHSKVAQGRSSAWPAIVVLLAAATSACGGMPSTSNRCTQADLDQLTSTTMPTPTKVKETRQLNKREFLDPVPSDVKPVPAEEVWARLLSSGRPTNGGGRDELLLGMFSANNSQIANTPAWVLFSSRLAQQLDPLAPTPGVKLRADSVPCVFVDVVTVLDARTGATFYGSTNTSANP